ncbi:MAG: hypothetical protein ACI8U4_001782 [Natronomonas sp.]|jgi:hypothetical protein
MLPSGMAPLDRRLRGGVPPGTLVAFTAPPETQSELVLEEVARANESRYVSTVRAPSAVAERLPEASVTGTTAEELLASPAEFLDVPDEGCLVVDAVTALETTADGEEGAYRAFLDAAAGAAKEVNGVVLLHAHDPEREPPLRWRTLARADMTWRLSLVVNPMAVETRLAITKHRDGAALDEPLKLRLTDHVLVDTSRDI